MTVNIIGSGNVAHHLAIVLEQNNVFVESIYSRNKKNAQALASKLYDTEVCTDLDYSGSKATLFFLCVSDDAIDNIVQQLILPENSVLVHTSGTQNIEALKIAKTNNFIETGVFYPLMTLSKSVQIDFSQVPICLEASDKATMDMLVKLAKKCSKYSFIINSSERKTLHLAAIFASNFCNHLWALSKEIVDEQDIEFDILKPIIQETLRKAMAADHPADVQTGPALRKDQTTIERHLALLKDDEDLHKVYSVISRSIQNWHNE
jgi:predicted short-subunit dehydrogenase-like oxidoreductase (DUF2520 family)